MTGTERLRIAVRYTFAFGQGHLSAFLSSLSMLGLVLAISLLIIVLSVMNGFDKEMRERILSLVPHITMYSDKPIVDWQQDVESLRAHPAVEEVAPFAQFDAMIMRGTDIETVRGIGLDSRQDGAFAPLLPYLDAQQAANFRQQQDGLILGASVAQHLGVNVGERLNLIVPGSGRAGELGPTRFKAVQLSAILSTGTELDQSVALVHLALAADLAGMRGQVSGFRITTRDLFNVQTIAWELQGLLPMGFYSTQLPPADFTVVHTAATAIIQIQAVNGGFAFNVVSSLVLVVLDKQGNIAILRTLGATGADIAWIFVLQGAMIGLVGVVLGSIAGALGSQAVPGLVNWLEDILEMRFLNTDVYPVSFLPVDLLMKDILTVGSVALIMCVIAAIYPARRAAKMSPALILSQDR